MVAKPRKHEDYGTPSARGDVRGLDEESRVMLFAGATVSQLATLFEMDREKVQRLISGLIPKGQRHGSHTYSVAEAAGRLVKPTHDIEAVIRKMNHADLPPALSKEFWNGQNARLKFERELGNYWTTGEVVAHIATAFKVCRTSILLFADRVARETGLSETVRAILKRLTDELLEELRANLVTEFDEKRRKAAQAGGFAGTDDADGVHPAEGDSDPYHGL